MPSTDLPSSAASALLADYQFSEGSGTTVADSSGTTTAATFAGTNPPVWVAGKGVQIQADTSYLTVPVPSASIQTALVVLRTLAYNASSMPQFCSVLGNSVANNFQWWLTTQNITVTSNSPQANLYGLWSWANNGDSTSEGVVATGSVSCLGWVTQSTSSNGGDNYWIDGQKWTAGGHDSSASNRGGTVQIGGSAYGASVCPVGAVYSRVVFYSRALTDSEMTAAMTALQAFATGRGYAANDSCDPLTINKLACEGDSITYGYQNFAGSNPTPYRLATPWPEGLSLTQSWQVDNFGITGQVLAKMLASGFNKIKKDYSPNAGKNVVTVFGGTNDLTNPDAGSSTSTFNNLVSLVNDYLAQGWRVIVIPTLSNQNHDATGAAYNALIEGHSWPANVQVLPTSALPNLCGTGLYSNATWFCSDGVHPTQAGATQLSGAISPLVNGAYATTMTYDQVQEARSNLLAFYPCNDAVGSTTMADASTSGLTGTIVSGSSGTAFGTPSILPGDAETCLATSNPGNTSFAFTVPSGFPQAGDFSVAFWVKTTSTAGISMVLAPGTGNWVGLFSGAPAISFNSSTYHLAGAATVNDGNLHYVVLQRAGGTLSCYVDGVASGTPVTASGTFGTAGTGNLLSNVGNGYNYTGIVDKIAVRSRALTTGEIAADYTQGSTVASVVAGTLSATSDTASSVGLSMTAISGGTAPYSSQLQRSPHGAGTWANVGSAVVGASPTFTDATVSPNTAYDYRANITDSTSGTPLTATTATLAVSTPASAATSFTLTGPTTGVVGVASTNFTVTPNGTDTGTITITPSGGGLSTPIVLTFSGSSSPQTFAITPTSAGAVTLTPSNNTSLSNPSALTYTASAASATAYTLTGPSTGTVGTASSNFTVTPNGVFTGSVTITPSGDGLSTPIVLNFSNSATPQTFAVTPASAGALTLTPTNSGSLTNPSALTYTATASVSAATAYTLTGPSTGVVGVASSSFTVTPNGRFTGIITITPSGDGLSTPVALTFNNSSTAQTFTVTPTSAGPLTLTPSNTGGLTDAAPLTYTASLTPATAFTLTGPSTGGIVNVASANFLVTPNGVYTGTITITPSGGGLSVPIVLTFAGTAAPKAFRIAPTTTSTVTLTPSNNGGLTNPSNLTYTATAATGGAGSIPGAFHWNPTLFDSVIASASIPAGGTLVGDLYSHDNVVKTKVMVTVAVSSSPPSINPPLFSQLTFEALADIDGVNTVLPAFVEDVGAPGSRHTLGPPSVPAVPGTTYYQVFDVMGSDFPAWRPCIVNQSNRPITVTLTARQATSPTA